MPPSRPRGASWSPDRDQNAKYHFRTNHARGIRESIPSKMSKWTNSNDGHTPHMPGNKCISSRRTGIQHHLRFIEPIPAISMHICVLDGACIFLPHMPGLFCRSPTSRQATAPNGSAADFICNSYEACRPRIRQWLHLFVLAVDGMDVACLMPLHYTTHPCCVCTVSRPVPRIVALPKAFASRSRWLAWSHGWLLDCWPRHQNLLRESLESWKWSRDMMQETRW